MTKFRTTNKKQLAARVLCTLLLGTCLAGGYSESVAWGAATVEGSGTVYFYGGSIAGVGSEGTAWGYGTEASADEATAWGNSTVAEGVEATA